MIDTERAAALRSALAADGYHMDISAAADRVRVVITATGQACAGCLVPKDMMRGMLAGALGVDPGSIDLAYPRDSV